MWTYEQSTGKLSHNGVYICTGYSGLGEGKNNPRMEDDAGHGPIPKGLWHIDGLYDSKKTGPYTLALDADSGTNTYGRSAFRIHGDSASHPGMASHGCIIVPHVVRLEIWGSGDHSLTVTG
jgi:hypothetical protein